MLDLQWHVVAQKAILGMHSQYCEPDDLYVAVICKDWYSAAVLLCIPSVVWSNLSSSYSNPQRAITPSVSRLTSSLGEKIWMVLEGYIQIFKREELQCAYEIHNPSTDNNISRPQESQQWHQHCSSLKAVSLLHSLHSLFVFLAWRKSYFK